MKKRLIIVLAFIVFAGLSAMGQTAPVQLDAKTRQALKELVQQVRDYAQTNVIPKMREWKTTLDNSMSSDDLQALNALRLEAARMKKDGIAFALALKKAAAANNAADAALYKSKFKDLKAERDVLFSNLKPLGTKYKSTLVSLGQEAKPSVEVWKQGGMKIVVGWYLKHANDLSADRKKAFADGLERLKTFAGLDPSVRSKLAAAMFMLWDGSDIPDFSQFLNEDNSVADKDENLTPEGYGLEPNFPNPFNPTTTISFTIPQTQHVSLIVYDALGRIVATLVDAELGAGNHSVSFDGQKLASGMYIYRIRSGDFVLEKKMQLLK
jgi:hypothetical protein